MTANDVKQAWMKVGDELSGLGLKLKLHAQQEFADDNHEDVNDVKDALARLADAIDDTIEAAGNAAKDPAVREDVKDTSRSLVSALTATIDGAVEAIRSAGQKPR